MLFWTCFTVIVLAVHAKKNKKDIPALVYTEPVQTQYGPVKGGIYTYNDVTVHSFQSIPFAAPPLGDLRFAPPQRPEPWTELLDAALYKNRCLAPEVDPMFYYTDREKPAKAEDCLYLTVVVPQTETKKKAVMVNIHSGLLSAGSSADVNLEALAIAGDVVQVSFNYRLNVFGFLADRNDDTAPGNVGFLDQVMALKWVQDNIENFGGDPEKVTIFGTDAGGWSVSAHMVSPLSKGLFIRAISQSGVLYGFGMQTRAERGRVTEYMAMEMKCKPEERTNLQCLRRKHARDIQAAAVKLGFMNFSPEVYGDAFLPQEITQLYDEHKVHPGVDYILGVTEEEGSVLLQMMEEGHAEITKLVKEGVGLTDDRTNAALKQLTEILWKHPPSDLTVSMEKVILNRYLKDSNNRDDKLKLLRGLIEAFGDEVFIAPTIATARRVSEAGNKVYLYYMDQIPNRKLDTYLPQPHRDAADELDFGTSHSFEMFYMFAHSMLAEVPMSSAKRMSVNDKTLSRSMVHAWTTFAKTGKAEFVLEDRSTIVAWPEFDISTEPYLVWQHPMTRNSIKHKLRSPEVDFWTELLPAYISHYVPPPRHLQKPPRKDRGAFFDTTKYSPEQLARMQEYVEKTVDNDVNAEYADVS